MTLAIIFTVLQLNSNCCLGTEHILNLKSTKGSVEKQNIVDDHKSSKEGNYCADVLDPAIHKMIKEKKIDFIDAQIDELKIMTFISKSHKAYWMSYLYYYKAFFYNQIVADDAKSSIYIDKAIEFIKEDLHTSDDYALYAFCLSFSIQFANMFEIPFMSSSAKKNANTALSLDPENIRVYCVLASHNFYTPKLFGGMVKVEAYASKGLACPVVQNVDYFVPTWGEFEIYNILIKYYEAEKNMGKLEEINKITKNSFPIKFSDRPQE